MRQTHTHTQKHKHTHTPIARPARKPPSPAPAPHCSKADVHVLISKEAAEMWLHGLHLIAAPDGEAMPPPTYVLPAGRWRALRNKAPQHLRPLLAEMYTRQPQIRRINGLDGANDADVVAEFLGGRLGELTETALEAGVRACVRVCACVCAHGMHGMSATVSAAPYLCRKNSKTNSSISSLSLPASSSVLSACEKRISC